MTIDAKKNVRKLVTFAREQLRRVEVWKKREGVKSRDEAIRQLVDAGLKSKGQTDG